MPRSARPDLFSLFSQLSFGAPWIATGLVVLPVLWWLLKVTPPQPRNIAFPPLRLLLGLKNEEQTPAHTPWWLLLLRLVAAALLILALSDPLLGRAPKVTGDGPVVLVIDNGWAAAKDWAQRQNVIGELLRGAGTRPVAIVPTASNAPVTLLDAGAAGQDARELKPVSWPGDRMATAASLARMKFASPPQIFWLSDGIDDGVGAKFRDALSRIGSVRIFAPQTSALGLLPPVRDSTGFGIISVRAVGGGARKVTVAAIGGRGETLSDAPLNFKAGQTRGTGHVALPLEVRNQTARLEIRGEDTAGAVQLLDSGGAERRAGIVSAATAENEQPLLSDVYYIGRALAPFAEAQTGTISNLLARNISVLLLADVAKIGGSDAEAVNKFISNGGVLVRFAGPRMTTGTDTLVPVPVRAGGRTLGSAMSWDKPQTIAPFPATSPFNGLVAPAEVTVSQQILAEPSAALADSTWARLADGTPLVTARQQGRGWIILFHVTASPNWSTLPLSGLYVDMLKRILALSAGTTAGQLAQLTSMAPVTVLDGFGRNIPAPGDLQPVMSKDFARTVISAQHPPGLYGTKGVENALNVMGAHSTLSPLRMSDIFNYGQEKTLVLQPWLLAIGAALLCLDGVIALWLRGYLFNWRPVAAAALLLVLARPAHADDAQNMKAALDTRLAYVITGIPDLDATSKAGLTGLGNALKARTSYEPMDPIGVDPAHDDLAFYPLLYWPMDPREKNLSPAAVSKISDYMQLGGTILFDTRDQSLGAARGANNPGEKTLRRLTANLDMPQLEPVPADHVLGKSFYLLHDYPGRWTGGTLWIQALPSDANDEKGPARGGDGVSPVLIGSNDWAAAWADGAPGGQHEQALRFGINLVMYALTGNYKTDQIHAPALLERMGK